MHEADRYFKHQEFFINFLHESQLHKKKTNVLIET